MSVDIDVYVPQISDQIIPLWVQHLNAFDMTCEISPNFSFATHSGFLPFKFKLAKPKFEVLKDKELYSGFELYVGKFDLEKEKQKVQPKPSLAQKFLGKKPENKPFHSPEIDLLLKDMTSIISFVFGSSDSFEFRFAVLASAVLTKLTNGVCYDGSWHTAQSVVDHAWNEVRLYEDSLKERHLRYSKFEGMKWPPDVGPFG